jgi:hypothetical protein
MMDVSETFHPEPPLEVPASFKKNPGHLSVSDRCLVFSSPNGIFLEWKWTRLDKATANRADFYKPMLRITHEKYGDFVFRFENREDLKLMKHECQFRVSEARAEREALQHRTLEGIPEERRSSSRQPLQDLEEMEIDVPAVSPSVELELAALRDEVYELKQIVASRANSSRRSVLTTPRKESSLRSGYGDLDPLLNGTDPTTRTGGSMPLKTVDDDEDEWHTPFGESSYTFLYICNVQSRAFWYGIFVLSLQLATMVLTVVDVVDISSKDNPLQIPPMVKGTVTAAQAVALFLLVAYTSDLMEAMLKLQDGFYPGLLEDDPDATFPKWLFSCLAQLFTGLLLILCSFGKPFTMN